MHAVNALTIQNALCHSNKIHKKNIAAYFCRLPCYTNRWRQMTAFMKESLTESLKRSAQNQ